MNLTIHRGTKEIGGSCVELKTSSSRLLVDFGIPLVTKEKKQFDPSELKGKSIPELIRARILPDIKGLYKGDKKEIDGILISHSHLDHYGLLNYVNPEIPIYMSTGAEIIVEVSNIFLKDKAENLNIKRIGKNKTFFSVGDFKVKPYLVDHSGFDARAFLVSAEGKSVFYSGDFRGHGRKSRVFDSMVDNPPQNIDCLLMEGSLLDRKDYRYKKEEDVEKRLTEMLSERRNITFLFASPQNVDRVVSAAKACKRTGSLFVIDLYAAYILERLKEVSSNLPKISWEDIRIKFSPFQQKNLEKAIGDDGMWKYRRRGIKIDEMARKKNRVLWMTRYNSYFPRDVNKLGDMAGARVAYSMWEGYQKEECKDYCKEKGIEIEHVHTSGHATQEELQVFAGALNPGRIIPIHTFNPEKYPKLFGNVQILKDGETLELN